VVSFFYLLLYIIDIIYLLSNHIDYLCLLSIGGSFMNTTRSKIRLFRGKSEARNVAHCLVLFRAMSRGLSFRKACEKYSMRYSHTLEWINSHGLSEQYAKARAELYDYLAEDIENLTLAPIERAPSGALDPTALGQRKLQIEARRWYLGKVTKKYSDKSQVELSGEITENKRIVLPFSKR
jgi:hypothetical protein